MVNTKIISVLVGVVNLALCQGEEPRLSYWTGDWVGPKFSLGVLKSLCHAGNESQFSGRPAWKLVNTELLLPTK